MATTALRSTRVVTALGVRPAVVVIDGEHIDRVLAHDADVGDVDEPLTDLGDLVLAPGLVDTHVHINEPGRTEWEGFTTATQAAAAGGVTTLVDMPLNCIPVTTSAGALHVKLDAAAPQLWVDVGFWGGVVPGNADALAGLVEAGALGAKAFMVHSGIDEFPNVDEHQLRTAMLCLREAGAPLLAHAELDLGAQVHEPDPRKYAGYLQSRPAAWEDAAIALLIRLCRETGCSVHVVHLSSADSLPQIRAAKAERLPLTVETCAHYLCLRAEDIADGDTRFKCAPPIRDDDNRERLWSGLREGVIDFVVTDHSPCTPALKGEHGDFHAAWGGIASLQLGLASLWQEAHARGIPATELFTWCSARPAAFAGLSTRKGAIAPGLDADLIAWEPDDVRTLAADELRFRHRISPYVGRSLRGEVRCTWLRGAIVYDVRGQHGPALREPPRGRALLHRDTASPRKSPPENPT
ncbi:MAG: allantoinase AllB [Deltaproteobacteria bacterium]|nr:allantoinase AllB [Nannocystaceae bacterium]